MYIPFSGQSLHQNYYDRLLEHFNLLSDTSSFAVFFEEPNHQAFISMCRKAMENVNLFYDDNILHSLALYAMWNSGLMGVNIDPINLPDEQKCGFRDFLKLHTYTDITVNYPSFETFYGAFLFSSIENVSSKITGGWTFADDEIASPFYL